MNRHKYLADYIDPFYLSPFMYPKTIINTTKDLEKHCIPKKKHLETFLLLTWFYLFGTKYDKCQFISLKIWYLQCQNAEKDNT